MSMKKSQKTTFFQVNITETRGKKKSCEICKKDFTVLLKEHQCKRCKRAVCYGCSSNRAPVHKVSWKQNVEAPHRQCTTCRSESMRMSDFINEYKLVFGKDTISSSWLQSMGNKLKYSEITSQYFSYLNDPQFDLKFNKEGTPEQLTYKKYKEADANMEKIFFEYCDAFNYSLQEFFSKVLSKTDPSTICIQIRNIMKAFINKHPEFGFDNELILVILFFLCFASEPVAFTCMSYFYDLIYPRQLYYKYIKQNDYDIRRYVQLIVQLLDIVYQQPSSIVQKTQSFLKSDFLRLAFPLTINALTFEMTYFMIDNCIQSCNFIEFLKGVTALCQIHIDTIMTDISSEKLQVILLRNTDREQMILTLNKFTQVDKQAQDKLISFFNQEETKEGIVLDEKYFQNKIMQSDQYKELLFRYEKQTEEKLLLEEQLSKKDHDNAELLLETEQARKNLEEFKQKYIDSEQKLLQLSSMPQQTVIVEEPDSLVKLQAAQIEELRKKYELLSKDVQGIEQIKQELLDKNIKLTVQLRESNKMLSDLAFEHQNLQYELEAQSGRGRTSTRTRNAEVKKLSPEVMEEKIIKQDEQIFSLQKQLDEIIVEGSEEKMQLIRMKRQSQEFQYEKNSLELEIEYLNKKIFAIKDAHQEEVKQLNLQIKMQYKKMFESLEVAYNRNDQLTADNIRIVATDKQIQEKMAEISRLLKVLQEDNEKLRLENEELNKIAQMAKKSDQENQLLEFSQLLNDEDPAKKKLISLLYQRANDLIKEIQFRKIDQLLKREYITQLQRKVFTHIQQNKQLTQDLEDQEKALKILSSKIDEIGVDSQVTIKDANGHQTTIVEQQNGPKEECSIM